MRWPPLVVRRKPSCSWLNNLEVVSTDHSITSVTSNLDACDRYILGYSFGGPITGSVQELEGFLFGSTFPATRHIYASMQYMFSFVYMCDVLCIHAIYVFFGVLMYDVLYSYT